MSTKTLTEKRRPAAFGPTPVPVKILPDCRNIDDFLPASLPSLAAPMAASAAPIPGNFYNILLLLRYNKTQRFASRGLEYRTTG